MNQSEMQAIVDDITFPKMLIHIKAKDSVLYLQLTHRGQCNFTGIDMEWNSRKWMLSEHMTKGELVQTAFKAIMTALEHEARELFRYKGQSIFDPHLSLDRLVEFRMKPESIEERA